MPGGAFESTLSGIFQRCEAALADRLAREKAKADALQAQDTSRYAFTLTDAIEHEVRPAVDQALASYDAAINRPITPEARWEEAVREGIVHAVEAAVRMATAGDRDGPWKPLLPKEAPKIEARLLAVADAHFAALGKTRKRRGRRAGGVPELAIRIALFLAGAGAGAFVMRLATS